MMFAPQVMPGDTPRWCVVLFASLALGAASGGAPCERGRSWWDRQLGACQPCTRCDAALRLVVKLPCQLHRDTVCQSLYDVKIFPFNTPRQENATAEPKFSVNDYEYYEYVDYASDSSDVSDSWDAQSWTLTLAASGCVVFFFVVLCMSFYHAKQWRILKQALKSGKASLLCILTSGYLLMWDFLRVLELFSS